MATQTNIEIVQGQTFTMTLAWTTDDTPAQPIPLSGYRAHMQVRRKRGATGTALLDLSSLGTAPAITLEPGGETGVIAVRIPATATRTLKKDCWYDLFVIASDDATDATRLTAGQVVVDLSVTLDTP